MMSDNILEILRAGKEQGNNKLSHTVAPCWSFCKKRNCNSMKASGGSGVYLQCTYIFLTHLISFLGFSEHSAKSQ